MDIISMGMIHTVNTAQVNTAVMLKRTTFKTHCNYWPTIKPHYFTWCVRNMKSGGPAITPTPELININIYHWFLSHSEQLCCYRNNRVWTMGADKRVWASWCDSLSQSLITAQSASCCKMCNCCTTYPCVTNSTCLLLHHLLSAASFSRSTLKYSTCIQ
jgi:hypothetical protein